MDFNSPAYHSDFFFTPSQGGWASREGRHTQKRKHAHMEKEAHSCGNEIPFRVGHQPNPLEDHSSLEDYLSFGKSTYTKFLKSKLKLVHFSSKFSISTSAFCKDRPIDIFYETTGLTSHESRVLQAEEILRSCSEDQ